MDPEGTEVYQSIVGKVSKVSQRIGISSSTSTVTGGRVVFRVRVFGRSFVTAFSYSRDRLSSILD